MRPEAEVDLNQEQATSLIVRSFPELAPIGLQPFGEGWDNVAWLVNDEFVFRFPRRKLGAECMDGELAVLPNLAQRLSIAIPNPIFCGEASDEFPWSFAGYRLLSGTPADELALDDDDRRPLARTLGKFLRELHATPLEDVASWGTPEDTLNRVSVPYRTDQARRWLREAEEQGQIPKASFWEPLLKNAEEHGNDGRETRLVHGDLYAKHLLIESGQLSGIIDWRDVHLGDTACDVAMGVGFFAGEAREEFFAAYGPVSQQTLALSIMRAVNHSAACLLGSGDDRAFQLEARKTLDRVLT